MGKGKSLKNVLSLGAMIASIVGACVALISTFFPALITDASKKIIDFDTQYITSSGDIRPTVVAAQANVFIVAVIIIVFLAGLAMANYYLSGTRINSNSVAVGGGKTTWPFIFSFSLTLLVFLLLGMNLPRSIFSPTNEAILSTHLSFISWAKNSWLGGCILGIIGFIISFIVATGIFSILVILPRSLKKSNIEKRLRAY